MADNKNEHRRSEPATSTMRFKKRLKSQVLLPSTVLTLRQIPGGKLAVSPVRKRRTASEQVNRHDR